MRWLLRWLWQLSTPRPAHLPPSAPHRPQHRQLRFHGHCHGHTMPSPDVLSPSHAPVNAPRPCAPHHAVICPTLPVHFHRTPTALPRPGPRVISPLPLPTLLPAPCFPLPTCSASTLPSIYFGLRRPFLSSCAMARFRHHRPGALPRHQPSSPPTYQRGVLSIRLVSACLRVRGKHCSHLYQTPGTRLTTVPRAS